MEEAKIFEDKILDDRESPTEKNAKDKALKALEKHLGKPILSTQPKKTAENKSSEKKSETEPEKPLLEQVVKNSLEDSSLAKDISDEEAELPRSSVSLMVNAANNDGWKLALVITNLAWQMSKNSDKRFQAKA